MTAVFPPIYHEVYVNGAWVDVSSYVVTEVQGDYGIVGRGVTNRVASVGTISFQVDNRAGTFSPDGGGTPLAGFRRGTPWRIRIVFEGQSRVIFTGFVKEIPQPDKDWGERRSNIAVVDWMDYAANFPLKESEILDNVEQSEAIDAMLSLMTKQPTGTNLSTGSTVFPTFFDKVKSNTKAIAELQKAASSEPGYIYLQGDGTLVAEAFTDRNGFRELDRVPVSAEESDFLSTEDGDYIVTEDNDYIVLEDLQDIEIDDNDDQSEIVHGAELVNQVILRAYPRTVDTELQVLFEMNTEVPLPAGRPVKFRGKFVDALGGQISGTNMQEPDSGEGDFEANTERNGSGSDITSSIAISAVYTSNEVEYTVRSPNASGWLTVCKARGFGIYQKSAIDILVENQDSIEEFGVFSETLEQKYRSDLDFEFLAEKILADKFNPDTRQNSVTVNANDSADKMLMFLFGKIGSLIRVTNSTRDLDLYHFIHGVRFVIFPGGGIVFTWILSEHDSLKNGYSPIAIKYSGYPDCDNDLAFTSSPFMDDLEKFSISAWVYWNDLIVGTHIANKTLLGGSNQVLAGWYLYVDDNGYIHFYSAFSGGTGHWRTNGFITSTETWVRIQVSFDHSSAGNNPVIQVNGNSAAGISELSTPSGTYISDAGLPLRFGQIRASDEAYLNYWNGLLKHARLYSRILTTTEGATLYSNPNDYDIIPDGLVFQGFAVKTSKLDDYINEPIEENMKIRDNVYGVVGTTHYDHSSTNNEIRGADPSLTSF